MTTQSVALVAHDRMKPALIKWAEKNKPLLSGHTLYATGTTGMLIEEKLNLSVHKLQSGPLGGDQQLGAKIVDGKIDLLIFFWDPLEAQPHDPDVRALLHIAVVWNLPIACNPASADFLISSPLLSSDYKADKPDYHRYRERDFEYPPCHPERAKRVNTTAHYLKSPVSQASQKISIACCRSA